jgi:hypothetical protein
MQKFPFFVILPIFELEGKRVLKQAKYLVSET